MSRFNNVLRIVFAAVSIVSISAMSFAGDNGNIVPIEEIKFFPLDPNDAQGIHMGIVKGNPFQGPSEFYLKIPPGSTPLHSHSASYNATVVKGQAKHWTSGTGANAPPLNAGSLWSQPKKQIHGDSCVSNTECLIYIRMRGKFDFIPAGRNQ